MEKTYIIIFMVIIIANFIVDKVLDFLNNRNRPTEVPAELKDFYDQEKYTKSLAYKKEHGRVSDIGSWISFIAILAFLITGIFGQINTWLQGFGLEGIPLSLAYFGLLFVASDILGMPFSLYSTFVIEEKYGFNKTTPKTYIIDKLKGYLMGAILGGGIMYLLLWLIDSIGPNFWIYAWLLMVAVMLFMNFFYTTLFVPIFNKLKPLEEGDLRTEIENLSAKLNFPLRKIMVMDASKRSTKSNAFFSGFGKLKSIVLFDTLIDQHSNDELSGVLAHEIGHYKKKHIISNMVTAIVSTGLMLFVLSWFMFNEELSLALGANELYFHLNLIAFGILYEPINTITGLIGNVLSRKHEYEADEYAVKHTNPEAFKNALKTLSTENLSDLMPHPAYVFVHYSHPTVLQRIKFIDSLRSES